jgi:hypothetical protein
MHRNIFFENLQLLLVKSTTKFVLSGKGEDNFVITSDLVLALTSPPFEANFPYHRGS